MGAELAGRHVRRQRRCGRFVLEERSEKVNEEQLVEHAIPTSASGQVSHPLLLTA